MHRLDGYRRRDAEPRWAHKAPALSKSVLLLGRSPIERAGAQAALIDLDVTIRTGTTVEDSTATLAAGPMDPVIMGAGLDLETRPAIARAVFGASTSTSVLMRDCDAGKAGMIPFVRSGLHGLR